MRPYRAKIRWHFICFLLSLTLTISGCFREDPELARVRTLTAAVRPVTDSGLMLDEKATPQQVAFALLQAIKDDVRVGNDRAARKAALDRQLALCAPGEILLRFKRRTESREEALWRVVRLWAPVVSYYVSNFDRDLESLTAAMKAAPLERSSSASATKPELMKILLPLNDPSEPENVNKRAMLRVDLSKESGLWRVCHVGLEPRQPRKETTIAPASSPSNQATPSH